MENFVKSIMRFGLAISFVSLCSLLFLTQANAQPIDLSLPSVAKTTPVIQTGKRPNLLRVKDGFELSIMSESLGDISALIQSRLGQYYSADFKTGRIWHLKDQNKNGRIDSKRILPHRFDGPSGLAIQGQTLYVADKNAIWVMEGVQPPKKLAGLRNAKSLGYPHPLAITNDGSQLFLGLKNTDGEVHLLSIDTSTGAASLVDTLKTEETPIAVNIVKGRKRPWVALSHSFGPSLSSLTAIDTSHRLTGMSLPTQSTDARPEFNNHIYIARQASDGFDVLSVKANLGAPETNADIILSGFLTASGRSAWGKPGSLLFDTHGLLIADRHNGDIYRLKAKTHTPVDEDEKQGASNTHSSDTDIDPTADKDLLNTTKEWEVSTIKGSQISTLSNIGSASSLTTGSSLLENYKSLAEEYSEQNKEETDKDKSSAKEKRPARKNR